MRSRGTSGRAVLALALAGAALAACTSDQGTGAAADGRPRLKPLALDAAVAGPDGRARRARVSTREGEILLMGIEGRVVAVPLNSPAGRRALGLTEVRLAAAIAPSAATQADAPENAPDLNAQQTLEADFRARRAPVLPQVDPAAARPQPAVFLGTRVSELRPGQVPQVAGKPPRKPVAPRAAASANPQRLVEVTVNLKQGVDADTAFAYATCALAGWAARNGTPFARHIRTLQQDADGRLRVASVFVVSAVEPMGLRVVEANTTLGECEARGIPAA